MKEIVKKAREMIAAHKKARGTGEPTLSFAMHCVHVDWTWIMEELCKFIEDAPTPTGVAFDGGDGCPNCNKHWTWTTPNGGRFCDCGWRKR